LDPSRYAVIDNREQALELVRHSVTAQPNVDVLKAYAASTQPQPEEDVIFSYVLVDRFNYAGTWRPDNPYSVPGPPSGSVPDAAPRPTALYRIVGTALVTGKVVFQARDVCLVAGPRLCHAYD